MNKVYLNFDSKDFDLISTLIVEQEQAIKHLINIIDITNLATKPGPIPIKTSKSNPMTICVALGELELQLWKGSK